MSKIVLILLTWFVALNTVAAQPHKQEKMERIKALKIAYVTEQLNLKADQAEKFWPVYNKFEDERSDLRKDFFSKYKNENPTATSKVAREYIDANLEYQSEVLELKKKYKNELLKTITAEQLAKLYKAESGFRQLLLKELCTRPKGKSNKS